MTESISSDEWTQRVIDASDSAEHVFCQRVRALLDYMPAGYLVWRDTGRLAAKNYPSAPSATVIIDGAKLSAARVVWAWHHGKMPPGRLRHVNECPTDDRIGNLGIRLPDDSIMGAGSRWMVCARSRYGPLALQSFTSFYDALEARDGLLQAYEAHRLVADLV